MPTWLRLPAAAQYVQGTPSGPPCRERMLTVHQGVLREREGVREVPNPDRRSKSLPLAPASLCGAPL
jgi:hypothetical protein